VCRLPERAESFRRLEAVLRPQLGDDCELLTHNASRGTMTTGAKRNELLRSARGKYIAFIDDDDMVAGNYVERIRGAAVSDPDCVGMEITMYRRGVNPQRCIHSMRYDDWHEERIGNLRIYCRCPNHLNPVRRELAQAVGFPDLNVGEDRAYSLSLRPLLTTEVMLEGPIYTYLA
jgi:glycosyltransferase involved in cell wall biosynthesis